MYSKARAAEQRHTVTPPPGYGGSRFSERSESPNSCPSCGEEYISKPSRPVEAENAPTEPVSPKKPPCDGERRSGLSEISRIFSHMGREEILLSALIIILAQGGETDLLLMLLLLLCL